MTSSDRGRAPLRVVPGALMGAVMRAVMDSVLGAVLRAVLFAVLFAVLGLTVPLAAQAQSFTWQGSAQARLEGNSNPGLQPEAGGMVVSRTVSAGLKTQRSSETAQTQGDAELILTPSERDSGTAALGRLLLRHRFSAPRDTWSGSLAYRRDRTLDGNATATDVAIGRSVRTVQDANLSWSHAFSERLSGEVDASHARTVLRNTGGSAGAGSDYAVSSASAGLRHAWRETTSLMATLGRSEQRPLHAGPATALGQSRIDSLRLSVNEALSESASAGVSVARSATTRDFGLSRLVCPLPVQWCQGGIVRYVVATTPVRTRSQDLQYSVNASLRWDETTSASARLARSLSPGALGVAREDVLSLSVNRSLSEYASAGLAFDLSRSLQASSGTGSAGDASSSLRSLSASGSYRLGEQLTLSMQLQSRHYQRPSPQVGATSTVFSISLQYQGATVPGWR